MDLPQDPSPDCASKKTLRIALLGYRSDPAVGGQGIYLTQLANALSLLGHVVTVFSGPPYPDKLIPGVDLVKVPSLDLYAMPNSFTALRLSHLASWTDLREWLSMQSGGFGEPLSFSKRVAKILSSPLYRDSFDIVHDNQCLGFGLKDLVAFYKSRNISTSLSATIHHPIHKDRAIAVQAEKGALRKWLKRRWYHFLDMQEKVYPFIEKIITVSSSSKQDIRKHFGEHKSEIEVVPCGVDTTIFYAKTDHAFHERLEKQDDSSTIRLICVSSSDQALKGLRFLVEAMAELEQLQPKRFRLTLVGRLSETGEVYKLAKNRKVLSQIDQLKNLQAYQVAEAFRQSDIAVVPSLYEGFGLPVIEAMACGVPLITTNGGALAEVAGDAALVIEKGSVEALVTSIKRLSADTTLQRTLRRRGLERVDQHFTWRSVATRFTETLIDQSKKINPAQTASTSVIDDVLPRAAG